MDKDKKKKYDGVEYIPSSEAASRELERKQAQARAKRRAAKASPARKPQKKANYGIFFAITMFTGVMVCVIVGLIVFNSIIKDKPKKPSTGSQTASVATPRPTDSPIIFTDTQSVTAMVSSALPDAKLSLLDLNSGKNMVLAVDSTATLKSKYGDVIVYSQIAPGDIVEVKYSGDTISELAYSSHAVEYRDISDVKIDTVEQVMTIGNTNLQYNNDIYLDGGLSHADLLSIKPTDVVSIRYLDNTVWYFSLSKSHGYIDFINKEHVENGIIEIDNNIMMPIEDSEKVEVLEGTHKIVVKGGNVEPISEEITITRGETATVDLAEMVLKKGFLILRMKQPDCTVYVDDEQIPTDEPMQFEYGEHKISATKSGFLPWEDTFVINGPSLELSVELTEEIKYCKLILTSLPEGAEIYIDNGYIGLAPLTVNVEYGNHTLLYRKEGYTTVSTPITLDTEERRYELRLQEEMPVMP